MSPEKYLRYLVPSALFGTSRTKEILQATPAPNNAARLDADKIEVTVYDYDAETLHVTGLKAVQESFPFKDNGRITWINIDGLCKTDVEAAGVFWGIHPLIVEDILSIHQRPKMDEVEGILYCLLNMLYYNEQTDSVEQEQVSIVLGKDFVLTFQEDPSRDVFGPIRDRLKIAASKLRQRGADYLCYTMLDLIVDNYFFAMEKLGNCIEHAEEEVIRNNNTYSLARINFLRKELIVLKRNITPVRDLVSGIIRSESDLLDDRTTKYFKDVYDHIIQAHDLSPVT
jgi:magnesium transporter